MHSEIVHDSLDRASLRAVDDQPSLHGLLDAFAKMLATKLSVAVGGPGAFRDVNVLALALEHIDPELPRRLMENEWLRPNREARALEVQSRKAEGLRLAKVRRENRKAAEAAAAAAAAQS